MPFSAGIETTRELDSAAGIIEVGYRPMNLSKNAFIKLGRNLRIAAFLQGGYKFKVNNESSTATGGAKDESMEQTDDVLGRIKLDVAFDHDFKNAKGFPGFGALPFKLISHAKLWYDIPNTEFYHSIGPTLRFNLPDKKDTHFDLTWQKGAGAPTFNEGTQFGGRLTGKY